MLVQNASVCHNAGVYPQLRQTCHLGELQR